MPDFIKNFFKKSGNVRADRSRTDPAILCKMGDAYLDKGMLDQAERSFMDAIKIDGSISMAHTRLAMVLSMQNKPNEAIKEFNEAVIIDPKNIEAYLNLSTTYNNMGRLDEAMKVCNTGLSVNNEIAELHTILGAIYQNKGLLDNSIKEYKEAIRIQPGNIEAKHNLAKIMSDQRADEEELVRFKEAVKADPDDIKAYVKLVLRLNRMMRYDEALEACIQGLKENDGSADLHLCLGMIYKNKGMIEDCIREYKEGVRIQPTNVTAIHELAMTLGNVGYYEESTKYHGMLVTLDPKNIAHRAFYVTSFFVRGMFEEAEHAIDEGLKISPNDKSLLGLKEINEDAKAKRMADKK